MVWTPRGLPPVRPPLQLRLSPVATSRLAQLVEEAALVRDRSSLNALFSFLLFVLKDVPDLEGFLAENARLIYYADEPFH